MIEVRLVIALMVVVICTYTDIKERNIYELPLLIAGLFYALTVLIELALVDGSNVTNCLVNSLLLPSVNGFLILVIGVIAKSVIGRGDIYLLILLNFLVGVGESYQVLIIAIILAGIYSLGLLVITKDIKGKSLPFVPFIAVGFLYIASI